MDSVGFLLDENVDPNVRSAIHKIAPGITVWIIGDPGAPARGTLDPDLLCWCEEHQFVLVTNNRSTMPVHLRDHLDAARHVPGIFVLAPDMSLGHVADELALIVEAAGPDEFTDQIVYLPL
jgi:hypothetical protein